MSNSLIFHGIAKSRSLAREHLPVNLRKALGELWGRTFDRWVRPILGFSFDVFERRYRTGNCEFEIPRDQTNLNFRACFFLDDYENEERALISRYLKPTDSVLEYGACIGVVSCTTNKLLSSAAKHVVIEGNPLLISTIAKNRVLNGSTFTIVNGLAAGNTGFLPFHIHPEFIVGGSTRAVGEVVFFVEALPLPLALERHGAFDVLILDVEGAELDLLVAGKEALRTFRTVILELHGFAYGDAGLATCRNTLLECQFEKVATEGDTEVWQRK